MHGGITPGQPRERERSRSGASLVRRTRRSPGVSGSEDRGERCDYTHRPRETWERSCLQAGVRPPPGSSLSEVPLLLKDHAARTSTPTLAPGVFTRSSNVPKDYPRSSSAAMTPAPGPSPAHRVPQSGETELIALMTCHLDERYQRSYPVIPRPTLTPHPLRLSSISGVLPGSKPHPGVVQDSACRSLARILSASG